MDLRTRIDLDLPKVQTRLAENPTKLAIFNRTEETGGDPAVVGIDPPNG